MTTLINISNHPSHFWSPQQRMPFSYIKDITFPAVDPLAREVEIAAMAEDLLRQVQATPLVGQVTVAGESRLFFALVTLLKNCGYTVIVATSHRNSKRENFQFVAWRTI